MTEQNFETEYLKLVKVYPNVFDNEFKKKAVAAYVKDLDWRWWAALVNRMILSSNPRIDIEDAARGERIARKRIEDTNALLNISKKINEQITDQGLDKALKQFGANSLVEAIFKK